eukprot:Rmarinus@m.27445
METIEIPAPKTSSVFRWHVVAILVHTGQRFSRGERLLLLSSENGNVSVNAPYDGNILDVLCERDDYVVPGRVLIRCKICKHNDIFIKDMCAVCGKVVGRQASSETHSIGYMAKSNLTMSQKRAKVFDDTEVKQLLAERKLSLVLDIDHTLLHATSDQRAGSLHELVHREHREWLSEIGAFRLPGQPGPHYVKLRPGLRNFLQETSRFYKFYIYTMGAREYAWAVAKFLDPDQTLFQNRIVSRDDAGVEPGDVFAVKNIKRLFPFDDTMVVILDDRDDVWKDSIGNLVRVPAYHFFHDLTEAYDRCSANPLRKSDDPQGAPPSPEESGDLPREAWEDRWKSDGDKCLERLQHLLVEVHQQFYGDLPNQEPPNKKRKVVLERPPSDVKNVLERLKSRVLASAGVVFSGLYPMGKDMTKTSEWNWVHEFGGKCYLHLDPPEGKVTHVVARLDGTAKVVEARNRGIAVVRPEWLLCVVNEWRMPAPEEFPLQPKVKDSKEPKSVTAPAVLPPSRNGAKKHNREGSPAIQFGPVEAAEAPQGHPSSHSKESPAAKPFHKKPITKGKASNPGSNKNSTEHTTSLPRHPHVPPHSTSHHVTRTHGRSGRPFSHDSLGPPRPNHGPGSVNNGGIVLKYEGTSTALPEDWDSGSASSYCNDFF